MVTPLEIAAPVTFHDIKHFQTQRHTGEEGTTLAKIKKFWSAVQKGLRNKMPLNVL